MGTRSTIKFYETIESEEPLLSVYQQFDGYIDGVGHDLANFLKDVKMVNGFKSGQSMENGFANGMGCLCAQFVARFKSGIGGFYITDKNDNQEYDYEVWFSGNEFIIKVDNFKGTPLELLEYTEEED